MSTKPNLNTLASEGPAGTDLLDAAGQPHTTGHRARLASSGPGRGVWLVLLLLLLGLTVLISLAVGSRPIPLATALNTILDPGFDSPEAQVIRELRLPRTLLGILAGLALGVAGALIQALTRNPLADPGILGVNAGAQFLLVIASVAFGSISVLASIWWALAGAAIATLAVYGLSLSQRGRTADPATLVLAGMSFGAVLSGVSTALMLLSPTTFDLMRIWGGGYLSGQTTQTVLGMAPFILVGLLLALACAGSLNAIGLGDRAARALGVRLGLVRCVVIASVTLLCGTATALAGPIGFVGLMVPHVARWLFGVQQGWILAMTCVMSPILLLAADIAGRLVVPGSELAAVIVTSFIGAPVLINLARRKNASTL
ncbi:iron chelate uptake ABC transporter family permease subunit [Glutamicibacter sp. MNS18]|uniref:FecCD family ABC transporter permease n=1 Tax=Glutamicibacter sp. MNS18 TaxID=2989817 RepID=UPI002235CFC0|nr:iron chelate uptake ABC transporter family permease subunit [Glutamicibacter sp. MNS18]MCW4467204.1 iron chelate uptake ABC transporter family permease subunit [Glutamicibacter sp. MNS18]